MGVRVRRAILGAAGFALALTGQAWAEGCKVAVIAELPVTMKGMRPMVPAGINGRQVMFLADSGAFYSTMSPAVATELKLSRQYLPYMRLTGVGGEAASVDLTVVDKFTLAGATVPRVQFLIAAGAGGGESAGLLGQNIWRLADVEYDFQNGVIRLVKPNHCDGAVLAYWTHDKPYAVIDISRPDEHDPHTVGTVVVNGVKLRAMFDTGAATSIMTMEAARRVGVTPQTPGVKMAGFTGGIGSRVGRTWTAPFASFKIGEEEVKTTQMRFGEVELEREDMLVGADFFLSHRVYVANSQRKLYLTYNGGPVFNLNTPVSIPASATGAPALTPESDKAKDAMVAAAKPDDSMSEPKDADGYARRGAAFASRRDYDRALTDLTKAIELAPDHAAYYGERARIRLASRQLFLAKADLDQVVKLDPANVEALIMRAELNLSGRDRPAAIADLDAAATAAPKEADSRLTIAQLYSRMALYDKAIAQIDLWVPSHSDETQMRQALNGRCWARGQLGVDLDKALGDCNRAVRMGQQNAAMLDSRGLVYLRRGENDRAIGDYSASLALNPRVAWSLYGRGVAELRKGMKAEGEADIAAAKALSPGLPDEAKARGIAPPA